MEIECEYIDLNRDIDITAWERFEELADINDRLWHIFWTISNDKKEITHNKICKNFYFNRFVLSDLYEPLIKLTSEKLIDKSDIEILFSLYLKMIPDCKCKECKQETYLKNYAHIRQNSKN